MLDEPDSLSLFPFFPRNNDFLDPGTSSWSARGVPGRDSPWEVPEGVRERTDDIDAAVLLLDRKLNTELRLLECALDFRSGDCITP
jgi:hypothetical protein